MDRNVAGGDIGIHEVTLVPNAVDRVLFADDVDAVEIITDGAAAIYFTVDGGDPSVKGARSRVLQAYPGSITVKAPRASATRVALISDGPVTYSVVRA